MSIRRLNVMSAARIQGIVGLAMGAIIGVLYGMGIFLVGAATNESGALVGAGVGAMFAIFVPLFNGGFSFVIGLIAAAIYNLAAGWVGGIEFEIG